jgi:hypothetical protein
MGDELIIPKKSSYVMVRGQVYNPTAISYPWQEREVVFEPRRGDDCHCGPERDLCDPGRWFRSLGEKQFKSLVGGSA